jgi:hypothetical protein
VASGDGNGLILGERRTILQTADSTRALAHAIEVHADHFSLRATLTTARDFTTSAYEPRIRIWQAPEVSDWPLSTTVFGTPPHGLE